jgi:hypothetical protein
MFADFESVWAAGAGQTLPGGRYPPVRIATIFRNVTQRFLKGDPYAHLMWIDDSSADVIKVDFDALYHGDVLVEGDTSEQFEDLPPLATAS